MAGWRWHNGDGPLAAGPTKKEFYPNAASNLLRTKYFFQCNGMHCAESVALLLDQLHESKTRIFGNYFLDGPLGRKSPRTDPFDSMKYVVPYTKRYLTFGEGKINAINGIFHVYERCKYPFFPFHVSYGQKPENKTKDE
jgi:hypothetical protein